VREREAKERPFVAGCLVLMFARKFARHLALDGLSCASFARWSKDDRNERLLLLLLLLIYREWIMISLKYSSHCMHWRVSERRDTVAESEFNIQQCHIINKFPFIKSERDEKKNQFYPTHDDAALPLLLSLAREM
jgi:hypothetical protein